MPSRCRCHRQSHREHGQAQPSEIAAQHDVGAAACAMLVAIVTAAGAPRLGQAMCASRSMLLGVQPAPRARRLSLLPGGGRRETRTSRSRSCQRGAPAVRAFDAILDVLNDGLELVLLREVDEIRVVAAHHRLVGRNDHHLEAVDLHEFRRFGVGGAGHAGQFLVEAEVILEGDRGDGLVLLAHPHALFGFHRLVQAIRPAPAGHGASGELINNDDLAVSDDVFHVALVERVRAQRRIQVMHQADVGRVVQALAFAQEPTFSHQRLDMLVAFLGDVHLLASSHRPRSRPGAVLPSRLTALEARHQLVDAQVNLGALLRRSRNDERRARLVDEDRVHFVDDRIGKAALHARSSSR